MLCSYFATRSEAEERDREHLNARTYFFGPSGENRDEIIRLSAQLRYMSHSFVLEPLSSDHTVSSAQSLLLW